MTKATIKPNSGFLNTKPYATTSSSKSMLDLYFSFIERMASPSASTAYLYQIRYIAKGTTEKEIIISEADDLAAIIGLDSLEIDRIKKAFSHGLVNLYLAITANGMTYDYNMFGGVSSSQQFFTTIISPDLLAPALLPEGIGILAYHRTSKTISTQIDPLFVCGFYDPEREAKALGVFAEVLGKNRLFNNQMGVFNDYTQLYDVGVAKQLKDIRASHIFNETGTANGLLYWQIGGKAPMDYYIYELWRYNVQVALKGFLQRENPAYTNSEIVRISDIVDDVSASMFSQYSLQYTRCKVTMREDQLPTDIENQLVNDIFVQLTLPSQIYNFQLIVELS